jgi:TPR repeat protein
MLPAAGHAWDPPSPPVPLFTPAVEQAEGEIKQGHLKEGLAILRKAADGGDASAEYGLAHYLNRGMAHAEPSAKGGFVVHGDNPDQAEALRLMTASAAQGFPLAQIELGWQYEMGSVLPRHPRLARDYYVALETKGAPSGHRGAICANAALGKWAQIAPSADEVQADAKVAAQDYAGAAALYLAAAKAGSATAAYEYAILNMRGLGIAKNEDEAKKWFLLSAGQGYPPAELELGRNKFLPEAERLVWLTKSADAGSPQAQYWLGQSKVQGRDGTPKDEEGGWKLLEQSAAQEDSFAKLTVAGAYLRGGVEGLPKDLDKAEALALEAAQDGNPVAGEFLAAIAASRKK